MLEAKDLHKIYKNAENRLAVLKGIDLTIQEGDVLAVVGPSGAGKSTLLHILGGLDKPTSGQVIMEGQDLYALSDAARSRIRNTKIGFIFQFYHLLPEFSALENVMVPGLVKGNLKNDEGLRTQALDVLEQVGLSSRAAHKPSQLSGGEQQRVAIARSLINQPKIVFCDEPTGNLDSESGQAIVKLLMELNAKNKQTFVIVTHNENIAKIAQRTIRMRDGKLI